MESQRDFDYFLQFFLLFSDLNRQIDKTIYVCLNTNKERRPVSDLRNKFTDIEKLVNEGEPVYLTKNGYGSMVVLSLEMYSRLTDGVEPK